MQVWSGGVRKLALVKIGTAPSDFPVGQVQPGDEQQPQQP
jgi:hypothetical protein